MTLNPHMRPVQTVLGKCFDFSALSDLANSVISHARVDQQTWLMLKSLQVIKQAKLGLTSEKEGGRGLCRFSFLQCQHYNTGISIYFPPDAI